MGSKFSVKRKRIRTFADDIENAKKKREEKVVSKKQKRDKVTVHVSNKPATPIPLPEKKTSFPIPPPAKPATTSPTIPIPPLPKKIVHEAHTVSAPKSTHTPTTKVPAFHEIQKQSPATKSKGIVGYDTAIITDTKTDRFNLSTGIVDSITRWFKNISKSKRKKNPVYTVPSTELRKGVIKKATTKTGAIFTADNEQLREQIKMRQAQDAKKVTNSNDKEVFWTPNTEPSQNLLEAPNEAVTKPHNVTLEFKRRSTPATIPKPTPAVPAPEPIVKTVRETVPEETKPTPADTPLAIPVKEQPIVVPPPIVEAKTPAATPRESEIHYGFSVSNSRPEKVETVTPVTNAEETRFSRQTLEQEPEPEQSFEPQPPEVYTDVDDSTDNYLEQTTQSDTEKGILSRIKRADTNVLTYKISLVMTVIVLVVYGGFFTYKKVMSINDVQESISGNTIESIIGSSTIIPITLTSQNTQSATELLLREVSSANSLSEFPFISSTGEEVSPAYLFQINRFDIVTALRYSITSARFVATNNKQPILVLSYGDRDTVLGGLLAWENSMTLDLTHLFNIPRTTVGKFADETISGHDVRILRNEETTVLLYGFVGNGKVIIANNQEDFIRIASLIQQK
jgi:hypothetical protein